MRDLASLRWVRIAVEMCLMHHVRRELTLIALHEIPLLLVIVVALDAIVTRPIGLLVIEFVRELAVEIRLPKVIHVAHGVAKWCLRALLMVQAHQSIGRHLITVGFVGLLVLNLAHGRRTGVRLRLFLLEGGSRRHDLVVDLVKVTLLEGFLFQI